MKAPLIVVDTNVVVSGLLSREASSPAVLILYAMLAGGARFLLSPELLEEYRVVLLRPAIQKRHGLKPAEVDSILEHITVNGIWREPFATGAGRRADAHLWALLSTEPASVLVTGDKALLARPPAFAKVMSPRSFLRFL